MKRATFIMYWVKMKLEISFVSERNEAVHSTSRNPALLIKRTNASILITVFLKYIYFFLNCRFVDIAVEVRLECVNQARDFLCCNSDLAEHVQG